MEDAFGQRDNKDHQKQSVKDDAQAPDTPQNFR
jgi:hypothetical protein